MLLKLHLGFTLLELIIVVIIIGVLATLAIPTFTASRERALGQEAIVNLRLIDSAQRIARMESNNNLYVACSCLCRGIGATCCNNAITGCNELLRLSLNVDNWLYSVVVTGGGTGFTATADRVGAGGWLDCQYTLTDTDADGEPNPNASCP